MNKQRLASELVRLAKELISKDLSIAGDDVKMEAKNRKSARKLTLRQMTMEDVRDDTHLLKLKVVARGDLDELNAWAKRQGLSWRPKRQQLFGGYWVDKIGDSYLIV